MLPSGTAVGRYVVEQRIGAGGMGEVYSARDSVLGRRVALKTLSEALAADRDRVERFMREARAASSLNHPAIVTVYDSGVVCGVPYLAMELIDGEPLAQWSRRNPKKIIEVLAQIADGLARAHASGLVHRDLKPDNIMVARGGFAKILDFGIAKLTERDGVGTGFSPSRPPEAGPHTAPAALLGTAAFMSPEQIEGRGVDHRSDVFSFGCLMHAVIEGRSPFDRDSSVKTMHAVVNDAVPPLNAPLHLQRIARRCLSKDPDERYQSIKDVALDLRDKPADAEAPPNRKAMWLAAPLLMAGFGGVAIWILGARSVEPPQITMQRITNSGRVMAGAVSPDGRYAVHATLDGDTETVWVRQIATGTDVRIIPPVDGFYGDMKVSPDGNYAFYSYAARSNPNVVDVYEVPMLGGESRKVVDNIDGSFAISPDGNRIAFHRFDAVERVERMFVKDLDSGNETVVMRAQFPHFIGGAPAWAPDGEHLTIVTGLSQDTNTLPSIALLDVRTKKLERINIPPWPMIGTIAWLPDGSGIVLCASDRKQPSQLWFVPANGKAATKITSDIAQYGGVSVSSDSKTLAAFRAENSVNLWLVPFDRPQDARALTTGLGNFFGTGGVQWLSDRDFVYTVYSGESAPSFRVFNLDRGDSREILQGERVVGWNLAVSPDHSRIAFTSDRNGTLDVWTADASGHDLRQVTHSAAGGSCISFFPDNRSIAYVTYGKEQAVWRTSIDADAPRRLTDGPANTPQVSPDGNRLLCRLRTEANGLPVWQTAILPIGGAAPARFYPIPHGGGPHIFQWLPNGRAFAYVDSTSGAQNIWIQTVDGAPPRQLTHFDAGRIAAYRISPDGKSIVVARGDPVNDMVLIRGFR